MKLLIFPLKVENPFPVKLKKGRPISYKNKWHLLLTGMGNETVDTISMLSELESVSHIALYGGAAAIKGADEGSLFEVDTWVDFQSGESVYSASTISDLPVATVTGLDQIYTKDQAPDWSAEIDQPLLYTMESVALALFCQQKKIELSSFRLVTDCGEGDIRASYLANIEKHRSQVKRVLEQTLFL